jgi:glycosyltransferase involved in cell wall biosynthesis
MSLYIDLTEFLTNPITTGIQRIEGEICRHLPPDAAIPVRLTAGSWIAFPPALIEAIARHFADPGESRVAEIRRIGAVGNGSVAKISQQDIVLVPEVFIEHQRLEFFRELPDQELQQFRFIVFDLLPVTHPEYFWSDWLLQICEYYKVLRRASCCAFISERTCDDYYRRLKRTSARGGVVLPLGCDSLGPRAERPALYRPLAFSVLGTIEPRKNHELILEAFEPLLRQIEGLQLNFIGKMGWVEPTFAQKVQALASDKNSGFRLCPASGDGAIRDYIDQSRATIYVSAAEGYGLPPVESLWLGTPVIASTTIPSLQGLGSKGIHYVEPLNVVNLRKAVIAFIDDPYANQKTEETMYLNLPTWQSFTQEVLRWCRED